MLWGASRGKGLGLGNLTVDERDGVTEPTRQIVVLRADTEKAMSRNDLVPSVVGSASDMPCFCLASSSFLRSSGCFRAGRQVITSASSSAMSHSTKIHRG
jgi:hypothetical protein